MTAIAPSVTPAAAEAADEPTPIPAPVLAVLVDNRARFLAFLERRVGGRDAAEEILQQAYVRGMDRGGGLRAGESAVAWFYRLLRNVLADHWRHGDAERRALAAYAGEAALTAADDDALLEAVCGCVTALVDTLKPELAAIIRGVDLERAPLRAYAARAGISPNNAAGQTAPRAPGAGPADPSHLRRGQRRGAPRLRVRLRQRRRDRVTTIRVWAASAARKARPACLPPPSRRATRDRAPTVSSAPSAAASSRP